MIRDCGAGGAGVSHLLERSTNLGVGAQWEQAWEGVLTGLQQVVEPLDTAAPARYYRAVEP